MALSVGKLTRAMARHAAQNTPVIVRLKDGQRVEVDDWDFEYDPENKVTDCFIIDIEV